MLNKKLTLLFTLYLIFALSFITALDFGGSLESYTKLGTPASSADDEFESFSLKQEEILTGWLRHNFDSTMFIASEFDVRFRTTNGNLKNTDDLENIVVPDLKLLRFFKKFGSPSQSIIINVGRLNFTDLTGTVFSQPADGINLSFANRRFYSKVYAGYTGLLNAQNVTILNDTDSDYSIDTEKPWYFAAPYTNVGAQLEFPYLFANQTLSAELLASFGTPGIESGTEDYNRLWVTLGLNGFLLKNLCYVFTTTIGTEFEDGVSNLTKVSFTYLPGFKNMAASIFGNYASGEQFGLKAFKGFTSMTAVAAQFEPEYSELVKAGASVSIKPIQSIFTSLNGAAVFSCPEEDFEYSGFEANLTGVFQIFSDLNINASVTQFFGKEDDMSKATFILSATLAF